MYRLARKIDFCKTVWDNGKKSHEVTLMPNETEVCPAFVNITPENLASEHLCCIIRSKKPHAGVEAKRQWLADRLAEGHMFRKLNIKGCAFIE